MELETGLERYAQLIIVKGLALEKGQELFVNAPIQVAEFTRTVVKCAYEAGASYVTVNWHDDAVSRYGYEYVDIERFRSVPAWLAQRNNSVAHNGAAVLTILSDDPHALRGIDQKKVMARTVALHEACKEFYDSMDFGKTRWCIVGAASEQWATRVFPKMSPEAAVKRLWKAILDTARVEARLDADALAAWDEHRASFDARKKWLNDHHFDCLRYRSANGTDLTVGLLEKGHWEGGGQEGADGTYFFPNIPTEEVFTSPDRLRVDGVVHSALPLVYNGSTVENFWIRFEHGKAVDCDAEVGADVLEGIIKTDENSCYLGEAALVPFDSPIRNTGILFLETLYDENASCHLALGKGFPETYENGYGMSGEELLDAGVNDSAAHVDFMIGTADLQITGVKADGTEVPVFVDGNWACEV